MATLDVGMEPRDRNDGTIDAVVFRALTATFCTGITVVTTNSGGRPQGMTANSFCSVSLDPLLVLVCLRWGSRTAEAISEHGAFAVHVLAEHQEPLSRQFSQPGDSHFTGLELTWNELGVPLLTDFLAQLECSVHSVLDGGDHSIVLGRVMRGRVGERPDPLLFFRGRYGRHAGTTA